MCCARSADTVHGTPDTFIKRGTTEAARITAKWVQEIADAVDGLTSSTAILEAMTTAVENLPLADLARVLERRIVQGVMLGALDSQWERENEEEVQLEAFRTTQAQIRMAADAGGPAGPRARMDEQPFDRMVREFRKRRVLPKDDFEQMSVAAKRRAFTVAGMAQRELLATVHGELTRQIEAGRDAMNTGEGPNLREFRKFMTERCESAGWTPANKSHVETIFRNNVLSAYSAGRKMEMFQPDVVAARPYGQWRAVKDDRARDTHTAADGVVLPLSDPFWQKAWPPAGHNCRCRVVSRSQRWVDSHNVSVGMPPARLPDSGWDSSGVDELVGRAAPPEIKNDRRRRREDERRANDQRRRHGEEERKEKTPSKPLTDDEDGGESLEQWQQNANNAIVPPELRRHLDVLTVEDTSGITRTHLEDLARVPDAAWDIARKHGVRVYVGGRGAPELGEMQYLRGTPVPGWPNVTWDDMAAGYFEGDKVIVLGRGRGGSRGALATHEFGHMLGHLTGEDRGARAISLHRTLYPDLSKHEQMGGPGGPRGAAEMFAEGVSVRLTWGREQVVDIYNESFARLVDGVLGL